MNWGYKLLVVIIVFIIAMVSMVAVSFKQTNEMVEENYYDKEVKYQSRINASENLNKVSSDTMLSQDESRLIINIPSSLVSGYESGQIAFLKSDNEKKDMTLAIHPEADGKVYIDKSKGLKGSYKASISFKSNAVEYYREEHITVK